MTDEELIKYLEEKICDSWNKEREHVNADLFMAKLIEKWGYPKLANWYRRKIKNHWWFA